MTRARPRARVGISGWTYPPWRGVFYPKGTPQSRELEYAAEHLDTVEVNGTFYSLQRPETFQSWRRRVPDGFVFSVKGGRYITHLLRLAGARQALANFFASGVLALDDALGPFLWQLPATLAYDHDTVEGFLRTLPHSVGSARKLAGERDGRMDGRTWTGETPDRRLRHALEARHPSFDTPAVRDQLRRHNTALVAAHSSGKWPEPREPTADFAYARLHGHGELYAGGYPGEVLDEWAERVRGWLGDGLDTYVYFDNDAKVRAPFDALALAERLRGPAA